MSDQSSTSFTSSSVSYSISTSNVDGQVSGYQTSQQTFSDPSGTTVRSSRQELGQSAVEETHRYDAQGRELLTEGDGGAARIQDVGDAEQARRDAEYEERMEDEYAKREGGA